MSAGSVEPRGAIAMTGEGDAAASLADPAMAASMKTPAFHTS